MSAAPPAPAGFIPLRLLRKRVYAAETTIMDWHRRGWPVETCRIGRFWYFADAERYPPAPPRAAERKRVIPRLIPGSTRVLARQFQVSAPTINKAKHAGRCVLIGGVWHFTPGTIGRPRRNHATS